MTSPVWLVDDQKEFFYLLRDALPKDAGRLMYFSSFHDLQWGLDATKEKPYWVPGVIFLDYFLDAPHTGAEAYPLLRAAFPNAKIIAFSSSPSRNQELLQLGAHFSIAKTPREEAAATVRLLFPSADALRLFAER